MKSYPISEFKSKCLRLVEEVNRTGEPIELTRRGKPVAVVNAPSRDHIDWRPGAFGEQTRILGDIECDLADLGIEWEAMR